ncbi:nitroreductase/quinone reductase family protein [Streptoalloteichus hindustanus]|uniref:Deazaflavin-dependent oxidoreductase, nitroreductase family n=1 Tax=Streptoalloteichus hindustanus TaxID=2017 RepID=A0A1M5DJQ8_STRHI|nr:nitroreductase/quinone reductase family protein [Streptoalloteichus hindustanus]SHF67207.1 deazaflavin-dependent oxidoreductase, nitroreductase family [Streptoalloteichus hindustanus]
MPSDFNQRVIDEFRANNGRVGPPFDGGRLLLLTTTGARSGKEHTTPVAYLPDGDRVLVIASAGGAPNHPAWYHNLVAHPRVTVEDGVFTYEAQATVLEGAERDAAFARAVEVDPAWADYQVRTSRVLPVVALEQVAGGPPNASSPGAGLKLVHDAFRRELALIRAEVARSGPRLGAQLRVNCLTLCQGLHHHHTMEDTGMFPYLAQHHPELAPVLRRLDEEHKTVATLLADLQKVISAEGADTALVLSEVERLTKELEDHLTYEEQQLIPILDA